MIWNSGRRALLLLNPKPETLNLVRTPKNDLSVNLRLTGRKKHQVVSKRGQKLRLEKWRFGLT